jgi:hypothetical protein
VAVTPEQGSRILHRLAELLTDKDHQAKLRKDYAFQVRKLAVANATGRPTPQARMVAQGMRVKGGTVLGFPSTRVSSGGRSTRMGGVSFGAEYGSTTHSQFAPRRESGYWLNPAAERVNDSAGNDWLDDTLDAALRRFG